MWPPPAISLDATNASRAAGEIAVLSGSGAFEGARGTLRTTGVAAADESITVRLL